MNMKKWTRWGIGLLCAVVVAFGVSSLAGVSKADEASSTVSGTVKSIDAAQGSITVTTGDGTEKTVVLSKTVWVFLDNHKAQISDIGPSFQVELILNTKHQAGYIKALSHADASKQESTVATSQTQAAASSQASQNQSATQNQANAAQPTAPQAQSQATAQASAPASPSTAVPWDQLKIKIEGDGFKLDIFDKGDHNNGTSMIKMKPKGRDGFFLKGDDAEHWIRTLLAGIDLKAPNAKQQIAAAFAKWFEQNGIALNVNLELQATTAAPAAPEAAPATVPAAPATGTTAPAANAPSASIQPMAQAASVTADHENEDEGDDNGKKDDQDKKDHAQPQKNATVKVEIKKNGKSSEHEKDKDEKQYKNGKDD
jgi:hypothetical protein